MIRNSCKVFWTPIFFLAALTGNACSIHIDQLNAEGTVNQQFDGENEVNGASDSSDSAAVGKKQTKADSRNPMAEESANPKKKSESDRQSQSEENRLSTFKVYLVADFRELVGKKCEIKVIEEGKAGNHSGTVLYTAVFAFSVDFERIAVSFNGHMGSGVFISFKSLENGAHCERLNTGAVVLNSDVVHAVPQIDFEEPRHPQHKELPELPSQQDSPFAVPEPNLSSNAGSSASQKPSVNNSPVVAGSSSCCGG